MAYAPIANPHPVSQSGTWNIGALTTLPALVAGSAIVGKVGIDQTTPGTTNKVSIGTDGTVAINAALPAGTALIGKAGIDQTTPGTTNAMALAQIGANTVLTGNGVAGTGCQRVTIASDNSNIPANIAQMNGVTVSMGNGVAGTGVQRVAIASDNTAFSVNAAQSGTWNIGSITTLPALVAGTALIGKVGIDQTTPGTTNGVALAHIAGNAILTGNGVTGTGSQRVTIASDNSNIPTNVAAVAGTATAVNNGTASAGCQRVVIASDNTAIAVNSTPPTLTKGTQGATGVSTQDLKDAGRVSACAATVIGGVTAVTTEALLSVVPVRDGVAGSAATTITVTSGKRFRVQAIVASVRSSAATVLSGRVALRMNPSGAATASSPILAILSMTQQAAALAEAGDTCALAIPDGLEFSGTMQFGLSQVCSGTGGVVYASIIGFEY
jgi:hypothetical protein